MAEPATNATLAEVDVNVHARMDTFERDLARVRSLLERFDESAGKSSKKLKDLEDASKKTSAAARDYATTSTVAKSATDASASSTDKAAAVQKELARTIAASEAALKKFDMATNTARTSAERSNTTWGEAAKNATDTGKSWFQTGKQILEVAGYIKLAAAVAHAGSPAFRAFTDNVLGGISNWLKLSPAVNTAKDAIVKFVPEAVKNTAAAGRLAEGIGKAAETYKQFNKISEAVELGMMAKNFPIAAAGALALSPALRQVVGQQMVEGAKAMGPAIQAIGPAASVAGGLIASHLIPRLAETLAFVSRIAVPVLTLVAGFKLLAFSISQAFERMDEARKLMDIIAGERDKKPEKPERLVSIADLEAAAELKKRMDDAVMILSQKWIPFQEKLIQLGMVFTRIWVNILEATVTILETIGKLPEGVSKFIGAAIKGIPVFGQLVMLWERLTTSKPGPTFDMNQVPTKEWDAAVKSIEKHTSALKADAASVGKSIEFREQLRAELKLLDAASNFNNTVTTETIAEFTRLRTEGKSVEEALKGAEIALTLLGKSFVKLSEEAGKAKKEIAIGEITRQLAQDAKAAEIATKALTAKSPAQKAEIAALQERAKWEKALTDQTITKDQVDTAAAQKRKLAYDTEIAQIREIQRQRLLTADQGIKTAEAEIRAIGQSVGARHRILAVEQARQQLESEAAARGGAINQRELAELTKRIERTSTLKQVEAERSAALDVQFQLQTAFMTDIDRQIAQVGFQLRGVDWQSFADSGTAAAMRLADAFKQLNGALQQIGSAFSSSIADFVTGNATAAESFKRFGDQVIRILLNLITQMLITTTIAKAMNAAIAGGGGGIFGKLLGGGAAAGGTGGFDPTPNVFPADAGLQSSVWPAMHRGGWVGAGHSVSGYRQVPVSFLQTAPRLHTGLRRGEFPTVLEAGERVIPRGGVMDAPKTVINIMPIPGTSFEQQERKGDGGINFIDLIQSKQNENVAEGRQDAVLGARFGASPAGIRR